MLFYYSLFATFADGFMSVLGLVVLIKFYQQLFLLANPTNFVDWYGFGSHDIVFVQNTI
jgi:hypothetical protein